MGAMEIYDCAFPQCEGILTTDNMDRAFDDVDVALMVGSKPRGPGEERGDLLKGKRGAAIIDARGASSAASAANACLAHNRDWELSQSADWKSMAVCSNGEYGVDEGLFFSYPVVCQGEKYRIVDDVPSLSAFQEERIAITQNELKSERDSVAQLLKN